MSDPIEELRMAAARGAEQRAADLAAGRARIGNLFSQPNYLRSYLEAARILVRDAHASGSLNKMAVACAYLQRHTLELALKTLIGMFHTVADDNDEIARVTGESEPSTAPPNGERNRRSTSHDLDALLRDLRAARQREMDQDASYSELPADLGPLVAEFSALEDRQPSRLRYPTVPMQGGGHERSFADESVIPIVPLQARLEALVDDLFGSVEANAEISSIGQELDIELQRQFQTLYYAGQHQ